ncbi:MAG TPA: DUF58 domain-containing protein [Gemmatimonadaceae bacterium]|nr:DUF58 domain-containing protein [Gemmatimonadaceae bacterium]
MARFRREGTAADAGVKDSGNAQPGDSYRQFAPLLDAVRGIRWPARSAVRGGIPGAHTSRLRGISAEFTEYRPYRQGDDPKRIDWKLFARSDRAYIRLSNDRAILPTMIVLDASASMAFPLGTNAKWQLAGQLGVGLGSVARNSGDPVGLVIARDGDPLLLAPRMRSSVTHEIIRAVSETSPSGTSPMSPAVSLAAQTGGRIVIITDFLGDAEDLLSVAGRWVVAGREVHAIHIVAREELDPSHDSAMVADPEASDIRRPMIGDARDQYVEAFDAWRDKLAHEWSDTGVSFTMAIPGNETVDHLIRRVTAIRTGAAIA